MHALSLFFLKGDVMASQTKITLTYDKDSTVDIKNRLQNYAFSKYGQAELLLNELGRMQGGVLNAAVTTVVDDGNAVAASGTVTCAITVATNTVTIAGVVFTCVASGATGNQFNVGGTDTITATSLAAAVNSSVSAAVAGVVSAASVGPVVTVSCVATGPVGNLVSLASSGATVAVSGATLSGGVASTNPQSVSYRFGI